MSAATTSMLEDLKQLPVSEKLHIIDELWGSIPPADLPVSQEIVDEMNRRWEDCLLHPEQCRPWEEVRAELLRGK